MIIPALTKGGDNMDMIDFDFYVEVGIHLNGIRIANEDVDLSDLYEVNDKIPEIISIYETIEDVVKSANKGLTGEKNTLKLSLESDVGDGDVTTFLDNLLWACDNEPVTALNKLMEMVQKIDKFDNEQRGAFIFFYEHLENSLVDAFDKVINTEYDYLCDTGDPEDFVKEFIDVPSELADYIDYDNLIEDLVYKSNWCHIEDYGYYRELEV